MRSNLDVLRAIAVLSVLCAHAFERLSWMPLNALGRIGVLLFFVHTSFVLMESLERNCDTPLNFYIRRAFRIYPLSVLTVLVVLALQITPSTRPGAQFTVPTFTELASNLALVQNLTYSRSILGVLWSLPLELQMYAVLPFLFLLTNKSLRFWFPLWLGAVAVGILQPHIPFASRLSVLQFAPNFLPGIIAYSLTKHWQPRVSGMLWLPSLLAIIALGIFEPRGYLMCAALGLGIPLFRDITFGTWLPQQIAKYSYGVYLAHVPILLLPVSYWWLLLIVPVLLFHSIEKPCMDLGKRMVRHADRVSRRAVQAKGVGA